jgi:hypothetical protein
MPFKTFTAGTLATASDVNTYLMNQSIATFSSTAARNAAITSPVEGQFAYIQLNDITTYYDGTAWRNFMFPAAWIAYTPTLSNITLGSGGTSAFYYQVVGKQVNVRGKITLGTTGALTGIATFTLPVNSILADQFFGNATLEDKGVQFFQGQVRVGINTGGVHAVNTAGTYGVLPATSATVPFTWGSMDVIWVNFSYESV